MDLSEANIEASLRLHRAHEHLNRTVKAAAIGLALLEEAVSQSIPQDELYRRARAKGELWGGMPDWRDPASLVEEARTDLGQSGLMRTFSALDVFLDEISADLDRWRMFSGQPHTNAQAPSSGAEEQEVPDRIIKFYVRQGWSTGEIDFLLPVYKYYRLARDCIAHRNGRISIALQSASDPAQWSSAVEEWCSLTGEKTAPPLIALRSGDILKLNHRDAILASSLLRRIGLDIRRLTIGELEPSGMVYLAARRVLLASPPELSTNAVRSAVAAVHDVLGKRYNVKSLTDAETIEIMRSIGIWDDCRRAFDTMRAVQR